MAYLLSIVRTCQNERCPGLRQGRLPRATVQLMNRFNEANGVFCKSCGEKKQKELQMKESK